MKFLIIGLGSMGKRRVRNLQYLKAGEIIGFDPRENRRKEATEKYGIKTFKDFGTAMHENPDVLIISTPPDQHMEYAMVAAQETKHFFVEASVVDDGMDELMALLKKGKKIVAAPSCTMRFHPTLIKIKELLESNIIGKPLAFSYHFGQYLPDWHPWEDYRTFYASKRDTGGCREMVAFELVWATWMFGGIDTISSFRDKLSRLDTKIDDVYQLVIKFKNGVFGHMLVDVIARTPYRIFRILGEDGVIEWDWRTGKIRVFAKDKKWVEYPAEEGTPAKGYTFGEKMYVDEMDHLLRAIKGEEKYRYTFEEDKEILSLLYAAERSSDKGVHVKVHGGRE